MKLKRSSSLIALSRNLLFWLLIPCLHFNGRFRPEYFVLVFSTFVAYAGGSYFNNYFLIPRYLMRRRYFLYIILLAAVIVVNSFWALAVTHVTNLYFNNLEYVAAYNHESIYYFIFVTVFSFTFLALGKFITDAILHQRKLEELEKSKLESELGSLRSQINPHFLFNALNTVYGMARRTDDETAEAILKLSDILRHGLYECDYDYISLEKEISFITGYIDFAKMRIHDKENISMQVDIHEYRHKIAPLLLIPFIENAIKHGLGKHASNTRVSIVLSLAGNGLLFRCSNSNYNRQAVQSENEGIGLKNVKRRLELLYPGKHTLEIYDDESTFTVELKVQLQQI